jgi:psp operon transcriptional activator
VIEYGELERVGGSQPLQVNVRLVCATNANLPEMVAEGNSAPTCSTAWPLTSFSCCASDERHHAAGRPVCYSDVPRARTAAVSRLQRLRAGDAAGYHWPGNIRELKNVVERSVYRHGSSETELDNIIIDPFQRKRSRCPHQRLQATPLLPLDLRQFQHDQENSCWSKA